MLTMELVILTPCCYRRRMVKATAKAQHVKCPGCINEYTIRMRQRTRYLDYTFGTRTLALAIEWKTR